MMVSVSQMRKLDELAVAHGLSILQMMENAGRATAELAGKLLHGTRGKRIVVLCGRGNNGGDGLCAARHLRNRGTKVIVILARNVSELRDAPLNQYELLKWSNVTIVTFPSMKPERIVEILQKADLIVDALLGYSLKGAPRGNEAELIRLANESERKILAIDTPSGLDLGSGVAYARCIRADWTLVLGAMKKGLKKKEAKKFVGRLFFEDLGIPQRLLEKIIRPVSLSA